MPKKQKILIIEDDKNIAKLVKYNLTRAKFDCKATHSAEEGLKILSKQHIDLIILDIMLPRMDGFEFCKEIKQDKKFSSIPVIMLTAKGEEIDRVLGLELGADDYVVKPFSPRELTLRVKAILKRGEAKKASKGVLTAGVLRIDLPQHRVSVSGREMHLTAMEFKLLVALIQRRGWVQSRERLLEDIWDIAADVTTRTIDTHIKRLRQKLGKPGGMIQTVRGVGYRFKEKG